MTGVKRLRVQHLLVQPVLVWDDGEELTPGPELNGLALPLSGVAGFVAGLPAEVELLQSRLLDAEPAQD
jgi:hypothetical protein